MKKLKIRYSSDDSRFWASCKYKRKSISVYVHVSTDITATDTAEDIKKKLDEKIQKEIGRIEYPFRAVRLAKKFTTVFKIQGVDVPIRIIKAHGKYLKWKFNWKNQWLPAWVSAGVFNEFLGPNGITEKDVKTLERWTREHLKRYDAMHGKTAEEFKKKFCKKGKV